MTAALEGGEWSAARPGRTLTPGNTRYPFYRKQGGPQSRSGRAENLLPTAIRSRTFHPVIQTLYRLSYRAHIRVQYARIIFNTALQECRVIARPSNLCCCVRFDLVKSITVRTAAVREVTTRALATFKGSDEHSQHLSTLNNVTLSTKSRRSRRP